MQKIHPQLLLIINRKVHICFRFAPGQWP